MARNNKQQPPEQQPQLLWSRLEAYDKIQGRIKEGDAFLQKDIRSQSEIDLAKENFRSWDEYNYELLSRIFDNSVIADEYKQARYIPVAVVVGYWGGPTPLSEQVDNFKESLTRKLRKLSSIQSRLELIPEITATPVATKNNDLTNGVNNKQSQTIFVVHGHDELTKLSVIQFLAKLEAKYIILEDVASQGRTIIEKFEQTAAEVGYAIVLLTADDIGGIKDCKYEKLTPRARQNAILELGYFMGKLGRNKVCALRQNVEIPSDYQGIIYINLDNKSWQFELAKEMSQAGINLDMNKLLK